MRLTSWICGRRPTGLRTTGRGRISAGPPAVESLENRLLLTAYVVDTLDDAVADDGKLSLREAVLAANTNAAVNEAAAGEAGNITDTVSFDASLAGGTITLRGTELAISERLTIEGLGADRLTIDANGLSRVFRVASTAVIRGLTITGGHVDPLPPGSPAFAVAGGGGVFSDQGGHATLDGCVVTGNDAPSGGGIYSVGVVTVKDSTITENTAVDSGGGIAGGFLIEVSDSTIAGNVAASGGGIGSSAVVHISGSTVSGNTAAGDGGGIQVGSGGILRVWNSTFSGNAAGGSGGALANDGSAVARNVTIHGNRADSDGDSLGLGGGVWTSFGFPTSPATEFYNSIVAGNLRGSGSTASDIQGAFTFPSRNNVVGDSATAGGLSNGSGGNVVGVAASAVVDAVLRDNGGPTLTHALVAGGPAVNAGSNVHAVDSGGRPLTTDQRGSGFARVGRGTVDIGAFERQNLGPVARADAFTVTENGIVTGNVLSDNGSGVDSDPEGDGLAVVAVNGAAAKVGSTVVLPSGALMFVYADGSFGYNTVGRFESLAAGETATETLTYTASDGFGGTSTATVTITITGLNDPPVTGVDSIRVREDGTVSTNVLTNDADPEGGPLALVELPGVGPPLGVWVALESGARMKQEADGTLTYDPNGAFDHLLPGETALEELNYYVADAEGSVSLGLVRVVVYGRGSADLTGYYAGEWWTTYVDGSVTDRWAVWRDAAWDALLRADANGDGLVDAFGMIDGVWYVGMATAGGFVTSHAATWADAGWRNVSVRDVNGDGKADLLGRAGREWWVSLGTGNPFVDATFATATRWAVWQSADWDAVLMDDVNADGRTDLIGFIDGEWHVARSTGTSFETQALWATWADVEWDALGTFDQNGDGGAEIYGLIDGEWYVGYAYNGGLYYGPEFSTVLRDTWKAVEWSDVRAGDFDGDGYQDLAARHAGLWYVGFSQADNAAPREKALFAAWADAAWEDVRTGDFDGDGRTDLIGRLQGQWWLSASTGVGSSTSLWATWADVDWRAVATDEIDGYVGGPPESGPVSRSIASTAGISAAAVPSIATDEDDDLALFWSTADEDDDLVAGLLAI